MKAKLSEKSKEINQPLVCCNIRPPDTCCFKPNMTQSMIVSWPPYSTKFSKPPFGGWKSPENGGECDEGAN